MDRGIHNHKLSERKKRAEDRRTQLSDFDLSSYCGYEEFHEGLDSSYGRDHEAAEPRLAKGTRKKKTSDPPIVYHHTMVRTNVLTSQI